MSAEPQTLWDELASYVGELRMMLTKPMNAEAHDVVNGTVRNIAGMLKRWAGTAEGRALPEAETRQTPLVLYPDLIGAVERARLKARENWLLSTHQETKVAYYGAMVGMELLKRELVGTQERDGAGSLPAPASEPVEASAPAPAPSRTRYQNLRGDILETDSTVYKALLDGYAMGLARGAGEVFGDAHRQAAQEMWPVVP